MKILVCVKQVPDTSEIKIDPVTNTLIRAGVPSIMNPFDSYALETAIRIKEKNPGTKITVLTMGPKQAEAVLREALSVGADEAYLLTDRMFGGADTFATSYTLSEAIRYIENKNGKFDLIFCGKQAIDGDTAQVGPEIAEHLGLAQVTYAIEAEAGENAIHIKRECDEGYDIVEAKYPCLATFSKTAYELRMPNVLKKIAAMKAEIGVISTAEIEFKKEYLGLKGSPTKVKKSFTPQISHNCTYIEEDSAEAFADKLVELMGISVEEE